MFAHLKPADALTMMERGRKRQALVPDFRLDLPCATGGTKTELAECKVISCCRSWYNPGSEVRATDRWANQYLLTTGERLGRWTRRSWGGVGGERTS